MALEFVNVSRSDLARDRGKVRLLEDDRRRVRTQVMLDFRRKERQKPANNGSDGELCHKGPYSSPVSHTVHSPELWRSWLRQAMVVAVFPSDIGYARLLEDNIVYTCSTHPWAPVSAIHDALTLLHVGSTSLDDTLLVEGKKRYVFAICELRQALGREGFQVSVDALLVVAMGALMSKVLSPDHPIIYGNSVRRG